MSIPPSWRNRIYRYRLVATKCNNCKRTSYPPSQICRYCGSKNVENIELLNEKAKLITWTVIYSVMDGFEEKKPLLIGIVETSNTCTRLLAYLTDVLPEELKPGMLLEPVMRRISENGESGLIHYGMAYRPVLGH
ncbi:MAG: Zn-ribbon domain-containing OB-fold protein [Desulfurococcaceae archaeon]